MFEMQIPGSEEQTSVTWNEITLTTGIVLLDNFDLRKQIVRWELMARTHPPNCGLSKIANAYSGVIKEN